MAQEVDALAKTTRINLLFDFYEPLLTDKQRTFLKYYFHDDYSLGEIAAESGVSRQAVYEHIKRAEATLESYEDKLGLLHKHQQAADLLDQLERCAGDVRDEAQRMQLLRLSRALRVQRAGAAEEEE